MNPDPQGRHSQPGQLSSFPLEEFAIHRRRRDDSTRAGSPRLHSGVHEQAGTTAGSGVTARASAFHTPLTRVLGIDIPILLAPMGSVAGGRLAAAVSSAGGLGLIGGAYAARNFVRDALADAGAARVGVGFITFALDGDPGALDTVLEHGVPAVQLSFGDPTTYVDRIHQANALVICQVQRVEEAKGCADAGADVIIAQGQDAGGHGRSGRGTFGLVPAVVDAVDPVPVVAAGGIADGRGFAAALALGAAGITLGTRLFASAEAISDPSAEERLVHAGGDDTVRTSAFDVIRGPAWPDRHDGRSITNRTTRRWDEEPKSRAQIEELRTWYRSSANEDYDVRPLWAGEGLDQIRSIAPAAQIIDAILDGAAKTLGHCR